MQLLLRACIRLDDVQAFLNILERIEEVGLAFVPTTEKEQRTFMRWMVMKLGREKVREIGGWLAEGLGEQREMIGPCEAKATGGQDEPVGKE